MYQRQHAANAELPFETEPDVDQDRAQRDQHRQDTVADQFRADLRADELDAAVIHVVAQRATHRLDGRLLAFLTAILLLDADQHVGIGAEFLQGHLAQPELAERRAHFGQVGGLRRAHLHQDAATEIDAEIQPLGQQGAERANHQQGGKDEAQPLVAQEGHMRRTGQESHETHRQSPLRSAASSAATGAAKARR